MNAVSFDSLFQKIPNLHHSRDSHDLIEYGRDWTRKIEPNPSLIVWPTSTDQVSKILSWCSEHDIAVVPSGGRTGLSGGAVAARGELVLSLTRMNQIQSPDLLGLTVKVQAGVVTEQLHHFLRDFSLFWPVDFASKGSSTVGGNIATNAGGVRVIRYGLTRQWVLGLTVVLMSGEVLHLNGRLEKNNTGLDTRQIFMGSEGIFGIITEAELKLCALPGPRSVGVFGLKGLTEVFQVFEKARSQGRALNAYEFFSNECLAVVLSQRGLKAPFSKEYPYYVLIETDEKDSELFENLVSDEAISDGILSQNPKEEEDLWALREGISESLSSKGLLHKHDIALPVGQVHAFLEEWGQDLAKYYPKLKPYLFGHIGDGNLHVNLMKPEEWSREEFFQACQESDQRMFPVMQKYQGSVSAEHGIGLLKKHLLRYSKSETEICWMKQMKKMFDPKGLLNPGKVI